VSLRLFWCSISILLFDLRILEYLRREGVWPMIRGSRSLIKSSLCAAGGMSWVGRIYSGKAAGQRVREEWLRPWRLYLQSYIVGAPQTLASCASAFYGGEFEITSLERLLRCSRSALLGLLCVERQNLSLDQESRSR
jgi:hypothetical protein